MTNFLAALRRWIGSDDVTAIDDLQVDYQAEVDLLYAWTGEPQAAENVEVEPGVYVRVLPHAKRVVGIEVIDCAARFRRKPELIDVAFAQRLIEQYSKAALARV